MNKLKKSKNTVKNRWNCVQIFMCVCGGGLSLHITVCGCESGVCLYIYIYISTHTHTHTKAHGIAMHTVNFPSALGKY